MSIIKVEDIKKYSKLNLDEELMYDDLPKLILTLILEVY